MATRALRIDNGKPVRRGLRSRLLATLAGAVVVIMAAPLTVPATQAAFAGDTEAAATFSADVLQPPVNLRLSHTCTALLGQIVDYYVDVAWNASPSGYATSVTLWRATAPQGPWTAQYVGTATTYRDTTIATGTTYYYAATAHYSTWKSSPSVQASVRTKSLLCL